MKTLHISSRWMAAGLGVALFVGALACSSGSKSGGDVTSDAPEADVSPADGVELDAPTDADGEPDAAPDQGGEVVALPAGEPCSWNDQCQSGFCVLGSAGYECAARCEEGCAAGYACLTIVQTEPDTLYVCVPAVSLACTPCADDGQCAWGRCLEIDGSKRCVTPCDQAGRCAEGFDCEATVGEPQALCLPQTGSCDCTSERTGEQRICSASNELGTCHGTEVCAPLSGGWEGCTAPAPAPEACDGKDNDCNGLIDDALPPPPACERRVEGVGVCVGVAVCAGSLGWVCQAPEPVPEACDYADNDCDGATDEDFQSGGVYASLQHCGACGVACEEVLPHAETGCDTSGAIPVCVVIACDPGYYQVNAYECESEAALLCLPCTLDESCSGGVCRDLGGGLYCSRACSEAEPCPEGYACDEAGDEPLCRPVSGSCDCRAETAGTKRACDAQNELGRCFGVETCDPLVGWVDCTARLPVPEECNGLDDDCDGAADEGLPVARPCEKTTAGVGTCTGTERCLGSLGWSCDAAQPTPEACNGADDDCDGAVDEDFLVAGEYASLEHCGACGATCVDVIPNAIEACDTSDPAGPRCVVASCEPGFSPWEGIACVLPVAACVPCPDDEACYGGQCVDLGEGSVCLSPCAAGPCPAGFTCQARAGAGDVCVPQSGSCACKADDAGTLRPCFVSTSEGTCWGSQACDPLAGWGACSAALAQAETCNGLDDDCDGHVDDDLPAGAPCSHEVAGVGSCPGAEVCHGADGWVCEARTPSPETCNTLDDDCDGQTDEGFTVDGGYHASPNCGVCGNDCTDAIVHGSGTCAELPSGEWGCVASACDEGYVLLNPYTCVWLPDVACAVCHDDDECPGTATCETVGDGTFCLVSCASGAPCPQGTTCTALADALACVPDTGTCDCSVANADAVRLCSLQGPAGTCHGVQVCQPASGGWSACDASAPALEDCNGKDDDCDGLVDEGLAAEPCERAAEGVGACQGTQVCLGGQGWTCDAPVPSSEACDSIDNDCDGLVDEDFKLGDAYGLDGHCGACFVDCTGLAVEHGVPGCVTGPAGTPRCGVGACDPGYVAVNPFACALPVPVLCQPCQDDSSCLGRPCVLLGGSSFCLEPCAVAAECPVGYGCEAVGDTGYCLPPSGTCGCTEETAGTRRACEASNALGTCFGTQVCDPASGWSPCSAATPTLETCNGLDDDCSGVVDDGLPAGEPCQRTNAAGTCHGAQACLGAAGWACNAAVPDLERCNGVDDDCDGATDEPQAAGCRDFYHDGDGDGAGTDAGSACLCAPSGGLTVTLGGDCDDADPTVGPTNDEACDGHDNDCDGQTDEPGAAGCAPWHADRDADTWGSDADVACLCGPAAEYTSPAGGDCDDADADAHPGATEACGDGDEDCDGVTDEEGAAACLPYFRDADADGFGAASDAHCLCAPAEPYTGTVGGDCSDHTAAIHPGAPELCNGFDDDCDGQVDEPGATGCAPTYVDADGDGYGPTSSQACLCAPSGAHTVLVGGDCDDDDDGVHPNAFEVCNAGVDDDCDGLTDEVLGGDPVTTGCANHHADGDADGYGHPTDVLCSCGASGPTPYTASNGGDCDDGVATTYPGASEACNGVDDDCDGVTDVGELADFDGVGFAVDYQDADGDGVANCVDPCPVYIDRAPPLTTSARSGTLGHPWPTVQAGLDAAGTCDQAWVYPGTYLENVRFNGHHVRLESVLGPAVTILDGGNDGAVVTFDQGEQPPAALVGFTVTHGSGNRIYSSWKEVLADPANDTSGGGVFVKAASPLIQGNLITDNEVVDQGGGLLLYASYAHVIDNEISYNVAHDDNDCGGGILATNSEALVERNLVHHNDCPGSSGDGGGLMAYASSDHYRGNIFTANHASNNGAGCRLSYYGEVLFEGNLVYGNDGQGVMVSHGTTGRVLNNTIVDNASYGLYIFISSGSSYSAPLLANNIIAYNEGCGVADNSDSPFTYRNNDAFGNNTNYCQNLGGTANPTGTDGNLSTNPLFVAWTDNDNYADDSFRLQAASPCHDTGADVAPYGVTTDFGGAPRPRGTGYDMGAYEIQE